jgi:hypothetical protein
MMKEEEYFEKRCFLFPVQPVLYIRCFRATATSIGLSEQGWSRHKSIGFAASGQTAGWWQSANAVGAGSARQYSRCTGTHSSDVGCYARQHPLLLLYGANLNQRDTQGYTALARCIDESGLFWLSSDPSPVPPSQADYVATAKWLTLHGASLQLTGTTWDNLLDLTRHRLHDWLPLCTFLLEHGATIHGKSGHALLLEDAAYADSVSLISLVLRYHPTAQQKNEALRLAVIRSLTKQSSSTCLRLLLEAGADGKLMQSGFDSDKSLLELAVLGEDPEEARLLIQYGADVNYKDEAKMTPLKRAQGRNNPDMEQMLRQAGARD